MSFKIACHVHSNWSYDGSWTLKDLAKFFANRGYKALLMTEHDRGFSEQRLEDYRKACSEASRPDFLVVPGIEYSDPTNTIHILTWGEVPFFGQDQPTLPMLQHVKRHNGIAVFAHPSRKKAWSRFDQKWGPYLDGIEIWNRKSDGICPSKHSKKLQQETNIPGYYGLDFHRINQNFPLAITMDIPAECVSESNVLLRLKLGEFSPWAIGMNRETIESALVSFGLGISESFRRGLAKTARKSKALLRRSSKTKT